VLSSVGAAILVTASCAFSVEVKLSADLVRPGGLQRVTVAGLRPGERAEVFWIDSARRARGRWNLRADGTGSARLRFRASDALPGRHEVRAEARPARPTSADGLRTARAGFRVLPGEPPAYLAVLDAGGLEIEEAEALAAELGASGVAGPASGGPPVSRGWLARLADRPDELTWSAASEAEAASGSGPWLYGLGKGRALAREGGGALVEHTADAARLVRAVVPAARVGIERVRFPRGVAPGRLLAPLDWAEVVPRPLDLALARSFAHEGCRLLTELEPGEAVSSIWRGLFYGHRGAILRPPLPRWAFAERPGTLREALARLDAGTAALFAEARWEPDPVLVFHSGSAVRPEVSPQLGGDPAHASLAAWAAVLADVGMAPDFADAGQIARGLLRRTRARALVLPRPCDLTGPVASEIVHFAWRGGLVVADSHVALLQRLAGEGVPRGLEELFGVALPSGDSAGRPAGKTREITVAPLGGYVDGVSGEAFSVAEAGLRTTTGLAQAGPAGSAALVTNVFGRGRGVYFNLDLAGYEKAPRSTAGAETRRLVRNALELNQVGPRFEVTASGEPVPGCERSAFRLDETEVLAVWRDAALGAGKEEPRRPPSLLGATEGAALRSLGEVGRRVELVFEGPAFCYDAMAGVLLGSGEELTTRLGAGPNVFCRLPYRVESISIRARETRGGIAYRAEVETSTWFCGTHVLVQEVRGPRSRLVPGTTRTIVADRGVCRGGVQLAENEPAGTYALGLRDVATGVVGEVAFGKAPSPLEERFPVTRAPGTGKAREAPRR
jgi:hypothetical protein